MKYIAIIVMSFFAFSCLKQKHEVRIKNDSIVDVQLKVGPTDFGNVPAGTITDYKEVPKGKQTISGSSNGRVTLDARGKHKYTLTVDSGGQLSFKED